MFSFLAIKKTTLTVSRKCKTEIFKYISNVSNSIFIFQKVRPMNQGGMTLSEPWTETKHAV